MSVYFVVRRVHEGMADGRLLQISLWFSSAQIPNPWPFIHTPLKTVTGPPCFGAKLSSSSGGDAWPHASCIFDTIIPFSFLFCCFETESHWPVWAASLYFVCLSMVCFPVLRGIAASSVPWPLRSHSFPHWCFFLDNSYFLHFFEWDLCLLFCCCALSIARNALLFVLSSIVTFP